MDVAPDTAASEPALDAIVVVESRLESDEYRVGTQMSVDRKEIEAIAPVEIEQLLKRLPGLSVNRPGGPGGVSEIFLRGAESNFTAVFLDGIRMNDSSNTRGGAVDLSMLASGELERLDIAMGAMSAIYGSDAMAGVIRMDSAYPDDGRTMVYGEAGTAGDWRAGASTSLPFVGGSRLGLSAGSLEGGDAIEGSSLDLASVSARLSGDWDIGEGWRIDLRQAWRDRTSYPEVSGGPGLAVSPELERAEGTQSSVSMRAAFAPGNWQSELQASYLETEDDVRTPAVAPGDLEGQPAYTSDTRYERTELFWSNRRKSDGGRDFAVGLDLVGEQGRDDGTVDLGFAVLPNAYRLDRTTVSGFVELGQDLWPSVSSTVALRLDHVDGDSRFSGKFGIAKSLAAADVRLWARIANGFKLPSFFALGNPLYGNQNLRSEEVQNLELGLDQSLSESMDYSISVFRSRYENLVDFDFETFTNVNRGRIDIDGLTVAASYLLSDSWQLAADATFANIDSASGELRRRPEQTGGIGLAWESGGAWSAEATLRYVGSRLLTSIPTGDVTADGYTYVDATFSYTPKEAVDFWFAVDNLFDVDYEDAPGFPAPGVTLRLGVRLTM